MVQRKLTGQNLQVYFINNENPMMTLRKNVFQSMRFDHYCHTFAYVELELS